MTQGPGVSPVGRRQVLALRFGATALVVFGLLDASVHGFLVAPLSLRLAWAALMLAVAYATPRVSDQGRVWLNVGLALLSPLFYAGLVLSFGGTGFIGFASFVALPVVFAVLIQGEVEATVAASASTLAMGMVLLGVTHPFAALADGAMALTTSGAIAIYAASLQRSAARIAQRVHAGLEASEARFRKLADSAPVLIWLTDVTKGATWFNSSWVTFTGQTPEQGLGWGWTARVHPEDVAGATAAYGAAFDAREPFTIEYRLRRFDGEYRWVVVTGVPRFDDLSHFEGYVGSALDITDRIEAERRLLAASRLKSQFLANMSHEIRTPLNAVIGLSQLALTEPNQAKVLQYVGIVHQSGTALLGVIDDLLDFSKIEAGHLRLEAVPFNLSALLDALHQTLSVVAEVRGVPVRLQVNPFVPRVVVGDPSRLRQVLTNLLGNAIKFTARGEIALEVNPGAAPGEIHFVVRDTGIGISPDLLATLFKPFTQGDASISRRFGGTGLGLSISRQLAQMMGGDLTVESTPGVGSVFHLHLRVGLATSAQESALRSGGSRPATETLPAVAALRGRRVLLVEDNAVNQLLARTLLTKAGVEVTLAEDGRVAIERACAPGACFDAILMDVQMPEMDGYEATRAIRANLGATCPPIIALTAHAMADEAERCLSAGMVAHLSKPIVVHELYATLAKHLPARRVAA
ncbi:MAG: ATP-binding protein [Archangium sp.]|nr:ATP-binding protein [Archangium sp.]